MHSMIPNIYESAVFLGINLSLGLVDSHDPYLVRKRRPSPEQANVSVDLGAG